MDKVIYRDILETQMLRYTKGNMPRGWILQQDNDPKHTYNLVKDWFKSKKIRLLEWPPQSPDLNPIEQLWEELDRRCKGQNTTIPAQKLEILQREWANTPKEKLTKLVDLMPDRYKAAIAAKGFPTKY